MLLEVLDVVPHVVSSVDSVQQFQPFDPLTDTMLVLLSKHDSRVLNA